MGRSIGLDVEQNGLGFVWFPGCLPYLVRNPSACEIKRNEGNKFYTSRVHQHVPFFQNQFNLLLFLEFQVRLNLASHSPAYESKNLGG